MMKQKILTNVEDKRGGEMSYDILHQEKQKKLVNLTIFAQTLDSLEKNIDNCIEYMSRCDLGELDGPLCRQVIIVLNNVAWGLGTLADKAILLTQNCHTEEYSPPTLREDERIRIAEALILYDGNRTVTAKKRRTLLRKIKEHKLIYTKVKK